MVLPTTAHSLGACSSFQLTPPRLGGYGDPGGFSKISWSETDVCNTAPVSLHDAGAAGSLRGSHHAQRLFHDHHHGTGAGCEQFGWAAARPLTMRQVDLDSCRSPDTECLPRSIKWAGGPAQHEKRHRRLLHDGRWLRVPLRGQRRMPARRRDAKPSSATSAPSVASASNRTAPYVSLGVPRFAPSPSLALRSPVHGLAARLAFRLRGSTARGILLDAPSGSRRACNWRRWLVLAN